MTSTMCKSSAAGLSKIASFEIGLTCNLYSRLEDVMMHVSTAQHTCMQMLPISAQQHIRQVRST